MTTIKEALLSKPNTKTRYLLILRKIRNGDLMRGYENWFCRFKYLIPQKVNKTDQFSYFLS